MSKPYILLVNGIELSIKLTKEEKQEYITICTHIWGCIPIDVIWAKTTNIYKSELIKYYAYHSL